MRVELQHSAAAVFLEGQEGEETKGQADEDMKGKEKEGRKDEEKGGLKRAAPCNEEMGVRVDERKRCPGE
uniref:Uncharacterized protein n=1 Tax=Chromera velia CCMP2878 TaxID=1169474 RepID=A0A0G4HKJ6_9ALVE|eukprot:Cvel_28659.t1-p1 / transcript=Cvel_28659.t1 / gene=Cvel_28659 / organism=Chromera_velia_CCMP2878 / gene_product=hypothetical protein / transcript_product=hypothetical protein / location=Cvel_scaffold3793:5089-5295(-) / protein_length=69 / sequence_SO=supercontig / SO=protein_coding / is_pseudo=false